MKQRLRNWAFGLLLVAFIVEILIFAPEEINSPSATTDMAQDEKSPEQVMEGVHSIETKDGGKEWELWAKQAEGSREKGDWVLSNVKVEVFGDQGFSYVVTGLKGRVIGDSRDMKIEGDVVTRSSNGYTFYASSIIYTSKDRQLFSPGDIHMVGPKDLSGGGPLDLRGQDMRGNLNDSVITIGSDVHAIKKVNAKQTVTLHSQRALFSSKDQSAQFFGDVIVEGDGARISGPRAKFEFDEKSQSVRSLVVEGGVKLTDADRWATAKKVDMRFLEDRFILSGDPRVVQSADELIGDEIIYSHGGKEIEVRSVRARFDENQPGNIKPEPKRGAK